MMDGDSELQAFNSRMKFSKPFASDVNCVVEDLFIFFEE